MWLPSSAVPPLLTAGSQIVATRRSLATTGYSIELFKIRSVTTVGLLHTSGMYAGVH